MIPQFLVLLLQFGALTFNVFSKGVHLSAQWHSYGDVYFWLLIHCMYGKLLADLAQQAGFTSLSSLSVSATELPPT
jgi:hypothetical protein